MVNVPNIERVIASIKGELPETRDLGFNMAAYVYQAGRNLPDHSGRNLPWVACVGGHAYILDVGCTFEQAKHEDPNEIEEIAQQYLGLSDEQANALFFDLPIGLTLEWIPVSHVIEVLERLVRAGEVLWFEGESHVAEAA
ncbi:hypothetical protein [Rhizobium laguerreae]|uniref:hypothetical protein n=1 Tax=Rhizobium laguerreae TaxID=1076926 RepID=UPI001C91872F|nr:hypothetical protein [Rhizobium laguerreae]MBY3231821.1 hypothetical protein [Rhizobium laguerreae]